MTVPDSGFPGNSGGQPPFGGLGTPPGNMPRSTTPSSSSGKKGKKVKAPKSPKAPRGGGVATRRNVRVQMLLAVAFAVVAAAGVAAFFQSKPASLYVVRVTAAVPAMASDAKLNSQLEAVPVSGAVEVDGAFTATSGPAALTAAKAYAKGKLLTIPVFAHAELSTNNFSANSTNVGDGQSLVSISVSSQNAVGGTLQVGDSVNVIEAGSSTPLARSIKIVSIQPSTSAAQYTLYILATDPTTADTIAGASSMTLALTYVQG